MSVFPRLSTHRRGAVILMSGNLGGALLTLVRNLIIARMIGVEDFGIASTFALAVTLIEAGTNLGLDRMMVQDPRGGRRSFQHSLQAIQLMRGVIGAVLTLIFAGVFASLMGVPQLTWAYQCLAIIPLFRGLLHLDMYRAQRSMRFQPFVLVTLMSNALALVAAAPLAFWLNDFRVMLGAVLLQQSVLVIASHAFASTSYGLRLDRRVGIDVLRFGAPLLLNGFVVFATLNGDQMLIGSFLGMEVLGWFAVAFSLTLVPATVAANTAQSVLLPGLSRCQSDFTAFIVRAKRVLSSMAMLAILMATVLALVGPYAIAVLCGEKYGAAAGILPWLAVLQGVRIAKAGPAIVSVARGDTRDPLIANVARLVFLPIAAIALSTGGDVTLLILIAILGEGFALGVALFLLSVRGVIPVRPMPRRPRHG